MFMEIAHIVAKRATCFRLNVGAVITHKNRIISIGYNGVAPGEPHCLGNDCPGRDHCTLTTHAEENALDYIPMHSSYDDGLTMYVTDSPCVECARKIIKDTRVRYLYFQTPYRVTQGLHDLMNSNIRVLRVMPSGIIVNWFSNEIVEE